MTLPMNAEECLKALRSQTLTQIDKLPDVKGVYALSDHLGSIRYIGIAADTGFRDRIFSKHVDGSEERSHKLACNYNIGRMWRNRKHPENDVSDAKISKHLRREFIRRHCKAAIVPIDATKAVLEAVEKAVIELAPKEMVEWNGTRARVNRLPEPTDLIDTLIDELGLSQHQREALERQSALFEKYGHLDLEPVRTTHKTSPNRSKAQTNAEKQSTRKNAKVARPNASNPTRDAILRIIEQLTDFSPHPTQGLTAGTKYISAFETKAGTIFAIDKASSSKQPIWVLDAPSVRSTLDEFGLNYELYPPSRGRNSNLHKLPGFRKGDLVRVYPENTQDAINFIKRLP